MKHLLMVLVSLVSFLPSWAGEKDWHLGVAPTILANPHTRTLRYGGLISLEKQLGGRKAMEFAFMATGNSQTKNIVKDTELLLLGYYKPVLSMGKNSYSHFKLGANLGFGQRGLLFGVGAGFEYNIVFRNRTKLFISQDNILVFRGEDRFSCGLSVGLKLPL